MRKHALSVLGLVAFLSAAGCTKKVDAGDETPLDLKPWAASFEGSSANALTGNAIASGPAGDLFLGGTFQDSTDLGGGALLADFGAAVFVAHLDEDGNHLFSGSTGSNDSLASVAIGPEGDLYVAGSYDGAINFGSGKLTGYKNGYVGAFESGGVPHFNRALGGEAEDWADDVALTPSGDVIVVARAGNDADFGDGSVVSPYSEKDAVVVAYNRNGQFKWDVRIPNAVSQPLSVASDGDGDVVIAGVSYSDIQIGDSDLKSGPGSFIAKIDSSGKPQWLVTSTSGNGTYPQLYDVSTGPDGSIFVAGAYYYGSFELAGLVGSFVDDSESFWLRLSPDGKGLHLHDLQTPSYYGIPQLAVAPNGDVLVGLSTYYVVDLGGGLLSTGPAQNVVLGRFTPEGQHIRSMELEGQNNEYLTDLAADPDGNAVVLGWFDVEMEIGGEKLTTDIGNAMFVARMDF